MEKLNIGINERIPLTVLEMALQATLNGQGTHEYFRQLLLAEGKGANRAVKSCCQIHRATVRNPLLPFLAENKDATLNSLRSKSDRPLLMAALLASAYSIVFDSISILGKLFHAQPQVTSQFLRAKLGEKYGANNSVGVAIRAFAPMLDEAGFIARPDKGVYEMICQSKYSDFAKKVYRQVFLLYNPHLAETGDFESYPFFEFIK